MIKTIKGYTDSLPIDFYKFENIFYIYITDKKPGPLITILEPYLNDWELTLKSLKKGYLLHCMKNICREKPLLDGYENLLNWSEHIQREDDIKQIIYYELLILLKKIKWKQKYQKGSAPQRLFRIIHNLFLYRMYRQVRKWLRIENLKTKSKINLDIEFSSLESRDIFLFKNIDLSNWDSIICYYISNDYTLKEIKNIMNYSTKEIQTDWRSLCQKVTLLIDENYSIPQTIEIAEYLSKNYEH